MTATATIYRATSVPFGAYVIAIPSSDNVYEDLRAVGNLLRGTGWKAQILKPLGEGADAEKYNPLMLLNRGKRCVTVHGGEYIVRSTRFGRDGKAGVAVMDAKQFGETFGTVDLTNEKLTYPNFPDGVTAASGMSEDVQVLRDFGLLDEAINTKAG